MSGKINELKQLLDRHAAFWRCENNEPLLHKIDFSGYSEKPYPLKGGRGAVNPVPITAADIDSKRLLGLNKELPNPVIGEKVNAVGPVYSEAWMESLIGCSIFASAYGCTAKPCRNDSAEAVQRFSADAALASEWSQKMDEILAVAAAAAGDRIGVRQLHLRGIIDMLAAYFGEERLCLNLYDCGKSLKQLSEKFTDLYCKVAQRGLTYRKPWQGGFVSSWGLFAPGKLLDYQVDASNMLSSQMYERYFLKFDERIMDAFDYSLVHIHASGIHILEAILKLDRLRTIEISLDRETGRTDISAILKAAKSIQDHGKALLIYGELSESEFMMFTRMLSPKGLAVFYWYPTKS